MADTLESLEIEVKHSASGAADEIKRVSSAIRGLGRALDKVLPTLSVFQKLLGKSNFNFTANDNHTTQIADTITNVKEASKKAESATKAAAQGVNTLSKAAKKSNGPLQTFIASLKRIAFYRILRTIIKEITQAFTEGIKNAYAFSQTINSSLSQALDALASSTLRMKNQLGAALGELLTNLQPLLTLLINLVTKAADSLSQFFAALGGRSQYHKAQESTAKFAEDTQKGAKAAKEWKNQLMGFDEINRLDDTRGSGSSTADDSNIGNWELADVTKQFPFLTALFNTIAEAAKLAWEIISKFWNEYLKPFVDWVGEKLTPVLQWLSEKFASIRAKLSESESVSEFLANLDLAETGIMGIITVLGLLGLAVFAVAHPFLAIAGVVVVAAAVIYKHWDEIKEWVSEKVDQIKEKWQEFKDKWAEVTEEISARIDLLKQHWQNFKDTIKAIVDIIKEIWRNLKEKWAETVENISYGIDILREIWKIFKDKIAGIVQQIKDIWDALKEKWDYVTGKIKQFIEPVVQKFLEWKQNVDETSQDISNAIDDLTRRITGPITSIIGLIDGIISAASSAWSWIQSLMSVQITNPFGFGAGGYGSTTPMMMAAGGFPSEGELFLAREAGPEMVGTIGGRTAVANNADIVAAVSSGVASAVSSVLGSGNNRGSGDVRLYINGREFYRATYDDAKAVSKEKGISLIAS